MEAVYSLLDIERGVPEPWGSQYDMRALLNSATVLRDGERLKLPAPRVVESRRQDAGEHRNRRAVAGLRVDRRTRRQRAHGRDSQEPSAGDSHGPLETSGETAACAVPTWIFHRGGGPARGTTGLSVLFMVSCSWAGPGPVCRVGERRVPRSGRRSLPRSSGCCGVVVRSAGVDHLVFAEGEVAEAREQVRGQGDDLGPRHVDRPLPRRPAVGRSGGDARSGSTGPASRSARSTPDRTNAPILTSSSTFGTVLGHLKQNIKTSVEGRGRSSGQGLPGAYAQGITPSHGECAEQPLRSPVL